MAASIRLARTRSRTVPWPQVGAWLFAFGLVLFLALQGGGFDSVIRDQLGIAVWWIVLLGAVVGVLPGRLTRGAWAALALLAAFALWTALSLGWSESSERTTDELAKVVTYLGVLVIALGIERRAGGLALLHGLASAIAVVAALAVLSRFHPAWFPSNQTGRFLTSDVARLSYPLNYWNGLAVFAAMGAPLLASVAARSLSLVRQAAAAAALPLMVLCIYLAVSRGGALALVVGVAGLLALSRERWKLSAVLLVPGVGAGLLIAAASQRDALQSGVINAAASHQGDQMLALSLIVCGVTALLQAALGLLLRHGAPPRWWVAWRRPRHLSVIVTIVAVLVTGIAVDAPGRLASAWRSFKMPPATVTTAVTGDVFHRLQSVGGNGRYQYWQVAAQAADRHPWRGTGAGTFELWWERHATVDGFVRDAHSLYMQTLAETGIPGLTLLLGLVALLLGTGARRSLNRRGGEGGMAAATASILVFAAAAAYEWIWSIPVMVAATLLLAGAVLGGRHPSDRGLPAVQGEALPDALAPPRWGRAGRLALTAVAVAALIAVAVPLAESVALRSSQAEAAAGRLDAALADADSAHRLQAGASGPEIQRSLILEARHDLTGAVQAVDRALRDEPTNWRPWLILSRLQAERGQSTEAVRAYRHARALNPRSSLFAR
ncbi:MAG TPA: O-antigen ligase family protein [Solirubrobacteraceae bacterium]|nr:O-antigen ligase family protein [Solirubrobacteraceae bacterium]